MPLVERYQIDYFAVFVLVVTVLILIFLIIVAIYFMNQMRLSSPNQHESTLLFWAAIILGILFIGILIFALIRLFTHRVAVYEEDKKIVAVTTPAVVRQVPTVIAAPMPMISQPIPTVVAPIVTQSRVRSSQGIVSLGEVI